MTWNCPHCAAPLEKQGRSYRCAAHHCFDEAREGYVNLLPVNRKRSREPGDNPDMVAARRRIHAAQIYRPLARAIVAQMSALADTAQVLDAGCGEGYYSGVLLEALPGLVLKGVDIAKPAVRLAAKAHPQADFAVASGYAVPLANASLDAVFTVFAPLGPDQPQRLLKPGGLFLYVCPAARHLWELRQRLYADPQPHKEQALLLPGLHLEAEERVSFTVTLEADLLEDLVAMTPYAYGGRREHKATLTGSGPLVVQMAFLLQRYRRGPG